MDMDFSGLWSWTVPLWALFALVLFLVGVLNTPVILEGMLPSVASPAIAVPAAATLTGGARKKRVRFAI